MAKPTKVSKKVEEKEAESVAAKVAETVVEEVLAPAPRVIKVLDEKRDYEHVAGIPSIFYRQDGVYFGANKKEQDLPVADTRSAAELDLEAAKARLNELEQEVAEYRMAVAKAHLKMPAAPVEPEAVTPSATVIVDVVDGDVVTSEIKKDEEVSE